MARQEVNQDKSEEHVKQKSYDPNGIEVKWQKLWEEQQVFKTVEDDKKQKYYCLEMYPYPSSKLHVGHLRNYTIGDCIARFKRMQGFNVLYPMGYDAFGLPAENAAIMHGADPKEWTWKNINTIKQQQKRLGLSYDWTRQIQSCDEEYYKWNQYFFLKMLEKGLAYRKKSFVNWCPHCKTVLANEQVIGGKCWRCHTPVQQIELEQWFLNIRRYAEELLQGLESLDWPERVKVMQKNWIGKSFGTRIKFKMVDSDEYLEVFTTRPDTLFGVTFLVIAPEHELARKWVKGTALEKEFEKFLQEVLSESVQERTSLEVVKKGFFLNKYAEHPLTKEKIPVYAANFVLAEYGSGIVMAVPAHDQRDFEFAKKYGLPIKVVIQPHDFELNPEKMLHAFEGEGVLINSQEFNGLDSTTAKEEITKKLETLNLGGFAVEYKLKDWLISRQRYWGTPIPVIYCDKCGIVPVPEQELPVKLPENVDFSKPGNPLANVESFVNVKCPVCGGNARRETDTMDTFVDSSWYFLRYCSPKEMNKPFDKEKVHYWMPVDIYIGGIEHATMHLIYARFFTKVLRDLGFLNFDEPFKKLVPQGMINKAAPYCEKCQSFLPPDKVKDGKCVVCGSKIVFRSAKMSKSLGNVVDPGEIINKYGADTARFTILAAANIERDMDWDDKDVEHWFKVLSGLHEAVFSVVSTNSFNTEKTIYDEFASLLCKQAVFNVTKALENLDLRTAVLEVASFAKFFTQYCFKKPYEQVFKQVLTSFSLLLNPFAPHLSEEFWSLYNKSKGFASLQSWPKSEEQDLTIWNFANKLIEDVNNVKRLMQRKGLKASKATIIIASDEKREALISVLKSKQWNNLSVEFNAKEFADSFKNKGLNPELGVKGFKKLCKNQDLARMLFKKEFSTSSEEFSIVKKLSSFIKDKTGLKISIIEEKQSSSDKAVQALPGSPSIVLE
ncbi:leucine--tRNA ligase [Candidatus Woesearchaeota archaeon]|nr:leucine--tRNA ligase [Candidatus Woesearchaeota archaeon]